MCPVPFYLGSPFAKEFAGIDIGNAWTKSIIIFDNSILAWSVMPSGRNYRLAAEEALNRALAMAEIPASSLEHIIATGPKAKKYPAATQFMDERICIARGMSYLCKSVRVVIRIGEETIRIISFNPHDLKSTPITGKSQTLSPEKAGIEDISTIVCDLADGIDPDVNCALIGEGIINTGLISAIENKLETKLFIPEEHRLVTALGAALIAEDTVNQGVGIAGNA